MTTRFARSNGPANSIVAAHSYEPIRHTTKARVANFLLDHVGEWIDASTFNTVGGRAGDRRMRELRQDGWKIDTRQDGHLFQHRLTKAPLKSVQALYRTTTKVA